MDGEVIRSVRAELLQLPNTSMCEDNDSNDAACVCGARSQNITQQLIQDCIRQNPCQYMMEHPNYGVADVAFFLVIEFECIWQGV